MDQAAFYGQLRTLCGDLNDKTASDRALEYYVIQALHWYNAETGNTTVTDTTALELVADQADYLLPDDCLRVTRIDWNDTKLTSNSTYAWDRDGVDYLNAASGSPREFAVDARTLTLYPPPDSTAIATDPQLTLLYRSSNLQLTPAGLANLPVPDCILIAAYAAKQWCMFHPSDENKARIAGLTQMVQEWLPDVKRRANNPIEDYYPQYQPFTGYRQRGYR